LNDESNLEEESKEDKDSKEILKQRQPVTEHKENVMIVSTPKQKMIDLSF